MDLAWEGHGVGVGATRRIKRGEEKEVFLVEFLCSQNSVLCGDPKDKFRKGCKFLAFLSSFIYCEKLKQIPCNPQ